MPGITASRSKTFIKTCMIGAIIALGTYAVLQLFTALLIHCEIVGEDSLYLLVCISAAVASFVGCGVTMLGREKKGGLSASAVVLIFLALTLVIALTVGKADGITDGFVGIGIAMAVGGLAVALLGGVSARSNKSHSEKNRRRTRKR